MGLTQGMTGLCHKIAVLLSGTNKSEREIIEEVESKVEFVVSDSSDWDKYTKMNSASHRSTVGY